MLNFFLFSFFLSLSLAIVLCLMQAEERMYPGEWRGGRTPGSSGDDYTIHSTADFLDLPKDLPKISRNRHCWNTVT